MEEVSGQDVEDRDGVSVWCYDGACGVCDSEWCEHHCHTLDDQVKVETGFAARGTAALGLAVWASIGAWQTVGDFGWSEMTTLAVRVLLVGMFWAVSGFVIRGLVGFVKKEEVE